METTKLNKHEREKIFEFFLNNKELRFSDIEKLSGWRSNHVSYHLQQMIRDGLIEKTDHYYSLTAKAEKMIPFFAHITGKEVGALPVILVAIKKDDKICLLKRKKRPYLGYWGLIGGKLKNGESIEETALREAKEETGLDCEFECINSVIHERLKEKDIFKHTFVLFFVTLRAKDNVIKCSEEGKAEWFPLNNLNKSVMIPSDFFLVSEMLDKKSDLVQVIIEEENGELVKFEKL